MNYSKILLAICIYWMLASSSFAQIAPPYFNDFETQTNGWSASSNGAEGWELSGAIGEFDQIPSGQKAWISNPSGDVPSGSSMILQSPEFDFSSVDEGWLLAFKMERDIPTNGKGRVDYSLDQGQTWNNLNDSDAKKSFWYNASNNFFGSSNFIREAKYSIDEFIGISSVMFRFVLTSGSSENGEGWMMDDFVIRQEIINLSPDENDAISGVSKNFPALDISCKALITTDFGGALPISTDFYFSEDALLGPSDELLHTESGTYGGAVNYNLSIPIPTNLTRGEYFILYDIDVLDNVEESNEEDNLGFISLQVDTTITMGNYVESFEKNDTLWDSSLWGENNWEKGNSKEIQLFGNHSGENSWYISGPDVSGMQGIDYMLTGPYLDFSNSTSNFICFWYQSWQTYDTEVIQNLKLEMSRAEDYHSFYSGSADYQSLIINQPRTDTWDCTCQSLSFFDNHPNAKLRFEFHQYTHGSGNTKQMSIDDIYIGPAMPDLSLNDDQLRHLTTAPGQKELTYQLFNAGPTAAANSVSKFWWSADNTLDAGDVLLGEKTENALADTSFVESTFQFSLPTSTTGEYFIFYELDANDEVAEYTEENNVGFFSVVLEPRIQVPYSNEFESQIDNWMHYSSNGEDNWEWDFPVAEILNASISANRGWVTNANGIVSPASLMHLTSPTFDLNGVANPVIEFDLHSATLPGGLNGDARINVSYSVDGGGKWTILDTLSNSHKLWYQGKEFDGNNGADIIDDVNRGSGVMFATNEPTFYAMSKYQGRDIKNINHYILDLSPLKAFDEVKFRFNLGSDYLDPTYGNNEGALVDNFSIKEGAIDLMPDSDKNLYISPSAQSLFTDIKVFNAGNFVTNQVDIKFYYSLDENLDGSDVFLDQRSFDFLYPEESRYANYKIDLNESMSQNGFLLYQIDPDNLIAEINEENNIGAQAITVDGITAYPYVQDFETAALPGWHHYVFKTFGGEYLENSFRMKNTGLAPNEEGYNRYFEEWAMNMDRSSGTHWVTIPYVYLESPIFDLSTAAVFNISFDLYCSGRQSFSERDGGTMEYTLDGGQTWLLLTRDGNSAAENWFVENSSYEIWSGSSYGWSDDGFNGSSTEDYYTKRALDISHLSGNEDVRFRFKYSSNYQSYPGGIAGFKLDNFSITSDVADYALLNLPFTVNAFALEEVIELSYDIWNSSPIISNPTTTYYYLSEDQNFDEAEDLLVKQAAVSGITQWTSFEINETIDLNDPSLTGEYFLFIKIDGDNDIVEDNEGNNLGMVTLIFEDHVNLTAANETVTVDNFDNTFKINYALESTGNQNALATKTKLYWSTDNQLDQDDIFLGEATESELSSGQLLSNEFQVQMQALSQGTIYIIYELDAENEIDESNEADNLGYIFVQFNFFNDLPSLSGIVFYDENQDQLFNADDVPIPFQTVVLQPDNLASVGNNMGRYSFFAPDGAYTLESKALEGWQLTTTPEIFNQTVASSNHQELNFGYYPDEAFILFDADITAGLFRCNQVIPIWVDLKNQSTVAAVSGQLSLEVDEGLDPQTISPEPDSISGNVFFWFLDGIGPFQDGCFRIYMEVLMPQEFGEYCLDLNFDAWDLNSEEEFFINTPYCEQLLCSFDPNDKLVIPNRPSPNYTLFEEEIDYTVRFQNTGNDTAFLVVIKDTLSELLDWNTFRFKSSSHPCYPLLNLETGEVVFEFANINLPDSTINEPASHGFVKFAIQSKDGLEENSLLDNTAGIYFDLNPPIITNTTESTLVTDFPTATYEITDNDLFSLFPNPTDHLLVVSGPEQVPIDKIEILDASGKWIEAQIVDFQQSNRAELDVKMLGSGIYLMKIFSGDRVYVKKFVVVE